MEIDNQDGISILGLLFSDYDFINLLKTNEKSNDSDSYLIFLKNILGKLNTEYLEIQDENQKVLAKNKINEVISSLELDNIDLSNYSWYEGKKLNKIYVNTYNKSN